MPSRELGNIAEIIWCLQIMHTMTHTSLHLFSKQMFWGLLQELWSLDSLSESAMWLSLPSTLVTGAVSQYDAA